jgi:hypothetical protein
VALTQDLAPIQKHLPSWVSLQRSQYKSIRCGGDSINAAARMNCDHSTSVSVASGRVCVISVNALMHSLATSAASLTGKLFPPTSLHACADFKRRNEALFPSPVPQHIPQGSVRNTRRRFKLGNVEHVTDGTLQPLLSPNGLNVRDALNPSRLQNFRLAHVTNIVYS